jgi:hypothetical protein
MHQYITLLDVRKRERGHFRTAQVGVGKKCYNAHVQEGTQADALALKAR